MHHLTASADLGISLAEQSMGRRSSLTLRIDEAEMLVETVAVLMNWHTIFATEPALEHSVVLELHYPRHRICDRRPMGLSPSVPVLFRQGLWLQKTPSALTSLSFQTLNLRKKLRCEPRFALKAFITGIAAQAQLHVTGSCFEGAPKNA
jgi:hypothetical protein